MIKQTVRSKMPSIKRCSLQGYDSEETESDDSFVADIEFALPAKTDIDDNGSVVSSYSSNVGDNAWFSELNSGSSGSVRKCASLKKRENGFSCDARKKQCLYRNENGDVVKGYYVCQDFVKGDIVWAKCGRWFPAWPAVVIDPLLEAPKAVLMACVPNTLCVMFYGFSKKGQRDYAWVKDGMVFPFKEYLESFQEQTQLYGSKPEDFRMAIEEACLAENGRLNPVDVVKEECCPVSELVEIPVAPASDQDLEFFRRKQSAYNYKDKQTCDSCGLSFHSDAMKKTKGITSQQNSFCEHCLKLRKSRQYCGICKKIWHHSDSGDWVCCDGCDVWVHAECTTFLTVCQKNSVCVVQIDNNI